MDTLLEDLEGCSIFAYDTETNGEVERFKVQLVGMSFAYEKSGKDVCCYLPLMHLEGKQVSIESALEKLKPIFENKDIQKICHNVKFDEMVMAAYDIRVEGFGHDTITMAWLLSEKRSRGSMGLKALVKSQLNVEMTTYEEVVDKVPRKRGEKKDYNFAKVSMEDALDYAAADAYYCFKLFKKFKGELEKQKLWQSYEHIEGPFNRVLGDMEARGVCIDLEAVERADKRLPEIMEEVEAEIYKEAGEVFNIGSGQQLGNILFDKLGIGKNVPRTKTGNYSTDKKTLELYASKHKIVENILRRKKIQKTHSTFVEGTKRFIASDGKVHPRFNGTGTVTGRLSGSSPNLQQIEGDEVEEVKVRNFFIASPGYKLLVTDYSQIELRVMAHFSKDKYMAQAFESGRDFHDEIARIMFDTEEPSRKQRVAAKTINFGVGYGRGPVSVAEQLGVPQEEARQLIDDWYKQFSGVHHYKEHLIAKARKDGYIRTLAGRKRRLYPDIISDDWKERGHAERQAFNTKIQGSAADIIKMAMITLDPILNQMDAFMVIQIHDELVIEIPEGTEDEAVATVKHAMENPFKGKNPLRVPLITEPTIVERWGDAK